MCVTSNKKLLLLFYEVIHKSKSFQTCSKSFNKIISLQKFYLPPFKERTNLPPRHYLLKIFYSRSSHFSLAGGDTKIWCIKVFVVHPKTRFLQIFLFSNSSFRWKYFHYEPRAHFPGDSFHCPYIQSVNAIFCKIKK